MEKNNKINEKELGLKPSLSIVVGVGWLIFLILWFAFYASDYPWEKNIAIILLSILVIFLLLGGMWAMYGIRKIPSDEKEMFKTSGFKGRILLSIILPFAVIIFLIIWFWFYAPPYSVWQNIAVILVTFLVIGGILGSVWARWGIKHGDKFDKKCDKED
jgi:peptidoglycan/LPS O-acetylase OafA/YrhL